MTDERYSFVEDVKNRKNVARAGGKKGKSKYGCMLPVDYMSTKEKRAENSKWISITYNRPISYDKFLSYSDEDKKNYLQTVIDKHGGTTERIAKLFGCTEAKVKTFRQDLNVYSNLSKIIANDADWAEFCKQDEFLRKPMDLDTFKKLDWYDQSYYISFLQSTFDIPISKLAYFFGYASHFGFRDYLIRNKIPFVVHARGYRTSKESIARFNEWQGIPEDCKEEIVKKDVAQEQTAEETRNYIPVAAPNEDPKTKLKDVASIFTGFKQLEQAYAKQIKAQTIEIPSLELIMHVDTMDEIHELLNKFPKAKKGSITIIFGGD